MKSLHSTLIATILWAGFGSLAFAQTTPPSGSEVPCAQSEKMHCKMAARHAQHLTQLKTKLKLEANQEAAWGAFSLAMQMPAEPGARPNRTNLERLTTPERLDMMQTHKAQRDVQMQKHMEATKAFYATLKPDQKTVFDAETARAMNHRAGSGRGREHGKGHHGMH